MTTAAAGTTTVSYGFGGIPLAIESRDDAWLDLVERRYGAFREAPSTRSFSILYECTSRAIPSSMTSPLSIYVEAPRIETDDGGFRATTPTTSCEVDLRARRAVVRGPRAAYPLDNLLRHLMPLIWNEGVLFHGAVLVTDSGRGVLACGPSGSGKSTLCSLAGSHALCDELAAVRLDGSSEAQVSSLPFWRARPGSAPLAAVLLLSHGDAHRLDRETPGEALRGLSLSTLWPSEFPLAFGATFDRLTALVQSVPVYGFSFVPRPDVWDFIEEGLLG